MGAALKNRAEPSPTRPRPTTQPHQLFLPHRRPYTTRARHLDSRTPTQFTAVTSRGGVGEGGVGERDVGERGVGGSGVDERDVSGSESSLLSPSLSPTRHGNGLFTFPFSTCRFFRTSLFRFSSFFVVFTSPHFTLSSSHTTQVSGWDFNLFFTRLSLGSVSVRCFRVLSFLPKFPADSQVRRRRER